MALRICYIAGREATYSRTRIMLKAMDQAGFKVVSCLPSDKRFRHYPRLIWKFIRESKKCDLILVGFYGQLLFPAVRLLTKKPILLDLYVSTFDTMVHDRGTAKPKSLLAWLYRFVDRFSMRLSDRIILETRNHIRNYAGRFKIPEEKFEHLFLASDESVVKPKKDRSRKKQFLVHFHGEYAPFHGVEYIIRAADLLRKEPIRFQLIGKGITYQKNRALAESLTLENITFIEQVPYENLADMMAKADCCLGVFGNNARNPRILTNKVVETLAAGKPLISQRNLPVQELVRDGESGLLVERGNPSQIAQAILKLKKSSRLRKQLGEKGHAVFLKHCTLKVFSDQLKKIVEEMVAHEF
jgi:glycosyltransferase involved in cell wall biosynthesis